jgi:hypothetical protein
MTIKKHNHFIRKWILCNIIANIFTLLMAGESKYISKINTYIGSISVGLLFAILILILSTLIFVLEYHTYKIINKD